MGKDPVMRQQKTLRLPGGSTGKESACNAGDLGSILGLERFPGGGNSYPLQYSCWRIPKDKGAWQAIVCGVAKSSTQLSDFHFISQKVGYTSKKIPRVLLKLHIHFNR